MRKAFGFILTVVLVISLMGCAEKNATITTETTSKEVATKTEAPVSEASTTDATATDASKANASSTDATATDASKVEASKTDATPVEASANDAEKLSEEVKDNVIITEGLDFMTLRNEWKSGTAENKVFCTYLSEDLLDVIVPFEVIIADEGSDTVEVNIVASLPEETELSFYLDGNVTSIEGAFHNDLKTCSVFFTNNPIEFSIGYDNGKVVKFVVNVTES